MARCKSSLSRESKKRLTRSDQGDEDCDDHKEYRNVFDNLRGACQFHMSGFASILILTTARRFFLTLMLKVGASIFFDGRSQTASE